MERARTSKTHVGRVMLAGIGSIVVLTAALWPGTGAAGALVGLAVGAAALAVAIAIGYVIPLRREVQRLQGIEDELEFSREMWERERQLREKELALARREAALTGERFRQRPAA